MTIRRFITIVTIHIFDIILLILSLLLLLWSLISFLGGPDGKFGSPESILWGIVGLFLGILALIGTLSLMRESRNKIKGIKD
jgi:hypothetical protein